MKNIKFDSQLYKDYFVRMYNKEILSPVLQPENNRDHLAEFLNYYKELLFKKQKVIELKVDYIKLLDV